MPRKIVIIGANAAGVDAASAARKTDRSAEITLVTKEDKVAYSRCGIPFVLGGQIESFDDLVVFPESFFKMMKLNLLTRTTVNSIDPKTKTVTLTNDAGNKSSLSYDSLIIATGADPRVPKMHGLEKQGVFFVRTIEDGQRIDNALETAKSIVIIGSGLVGLEVAVACRERGLKVTIVEFLPCVLPFLLDNDLADRVQKNLEEKSVTFVLGEPVEEILGSTKVTGVRVAQNIIPADVVVVATGVTPNVELAKNAGVKVGKTKAIKTNSKMETNIPDIYAAGDCVESVNLVTGEPMLSQLGTTAVRQGKVAGTNAAGGVSEFMGTLGSWITRLFDIEVGGAGLPGFMAKKYGIKSVSATINSKTRADYYPGALPIRIKLVAEKETGKLLSAQIIGGEEVTQRINALSFMIQKEMTAQELAQAETCYAPPVSETWEPMVLAADLLLKKLK
ncbi:MAG: FAD-dependent oxidoreductase [Candidatus Bathyarchaeota archaeon]|nr:MAG: FAD-dependent oxidoreductase [Candidatus Bathyarchaeum tardum]WNZ29696.1 MAG: FAD-dependent oxidoreductase [Candidatus Bathyarchaeota archaeon]